MTRHSPKYRFVASLSVVLAFFVVLALAWPTFWELVAEEKKDTIYLPTTTTSPDSLLSVGSPLPDFIARHQDTPNSVKAVYLSSWLAGSQELRNNFLKRLEKTEINTIVIDIKDSSGKIFIKLDSPELAKYNPFEKRVTDIKEFIEELHQRGYYVIGKVAVFHDDHLTEIRPDLAMRRKDNNELWRDDKGIAWLDVSQKEVWDYNITLAREAYAVGFDEINFDYVRFPSDGALSQIRYRNFDPQRQTREEVLTSFFSYLHEGLKGTGVKTSANIFGMVLTNEDDLGIGQILEKIAPYVDYLAPMLYPSHYPKGWAGLKNPAANPYRVIDLSLEDGLARLEKAGWPKEKIRPWLQDFDLGVTYTPTRVASQIKAVEDNELSSWMMWDASNKYSLTVYQK